MEDFDVRDVPFEADESRTMTLKENVIEARRLHTKGVALGKEGTELKAEAKEYHPSIMKGLEDIGTEKMDFDGKLVSIKEMEAWAFPQEHKHEIIQWCIEHDRMEFIDIPTTKFKTACKAALEAEQDLPPYAELKTFTKLNGV